MSAITSWRATDNLLSGDLSKFAETGFDRVVDARRRAEVGTNSCFLLFAQKINTHLLVLHECQLCFPFFFSLALARFENKLRAAGALLPTATDEYSMPRQRGASSNKLRATSSDADSAAGGEHALNPLRSTSASSDTYKKMFLSNC